MGHGAAPDNPITAVRLRSLGEADWTAILAGEPDEVARWIRAAAEHGFKAAQVTWGQMLLDGRGVSRDPAAAFAWFSRAAEIGSPDGINMVGRCHELGWGVPVDHAEAARHYRRAAQKGSDWGSFNFGCMLLYGTGIGHDRGEARVWFQRAAEAGNAKAMGMLGRFHEEGWDVPVDRDAARRWYRKGADAGDCWARFNLARMIAPADPDGALCLLRRALETGTANFLRQAGADLLDFADPAIRELGLDAIRRGCRENGDDCFLLGRALARFDGPDRRAEALLWLGRARDAGHAGAAALIAELEPPAFVQGRTQSRTRVWQRFKSLFGRLTAWVDAQLQPATRASLAFRGRRLPPLSRMP